jgi:hypothetical protein
LVKYLKNCIERAQAECFASPACIS